MRLARGWAFPGKKGIAHRVGGLEKNSPKGSLSHDPLNHQQMVDARAAKVQRVQEFIPEQQVIGHPEGDLLVIGWGGTFGHLFDAVHEMQANGKRFHFAISTTLTLCLKIPARFLKVLKNWWFVSLTWVNSLITYA